MGSPSDPGIVPRLSADIFAQLSSRTVQETANQQSEASSSSRKFQISVSFLEIYNEKIKDLLNPSEKPLTIRENIEQGVYIDGLCEVLVRDATEIMK
jgi:hypothetical protein